MVIIIIIEDNNTTGKKEFPCCIDTYYINMHLAVLELPSYLSVNSYVVCTHSVLKLNCTRIFTFQNTNHKTQC